MSVDGVRPLVEYSGELQILRSQKKRRRSASSQKSRMMLAF